MKEDIEKILDILKKQAEAFLLDAKEFYPFGTYINMQNKLVPVGAYFENDRTPSSEVIDFLEKNFKEEIQKGKYKIAAIAVDVIVRENGEANDAIEIRFFEPNKEAYKRYLKYNIKEHSVEFSDYFPIT